MEEGLQAQVGKNERGVPGRGNTQHVWLKRTWPLPWPRGVELTGKEWWQKRLGCCWASSLASLPPDRPLPAWATLPDWSFSTTADTSSGLCCLPVHGPSQAAGALSGILHLLCSHSAPSPPATVQSLFPGSAMRIPGLFLPPRMPFTFLPTSQDQIRLLVSPFSDS